LIAFKDLPSELRVESIADKYGAVGEAASGVGVMVCGSPGETQNNPYLGDEFDIGMDDRMDQNTNIEEFKAQKYSVWTTIALYSEDQLRQRMAWALSQILALVTSAVGRAEETEMYLAYYDIFVRNAFGNYRDILKEIAYNPLMAEMLSYLQNKSTGYNAEVMNLKDIFPDENFAREIMQLFSIGFVRLNMDGTPVTRPDGTVEQTYSNFDVMENARAWTGFDKQPSRGNIETLTFLNRIDPMRIDTRWRDYLPKCDINGGYIGDGVPLCVDLPEKQFLKVGAKYRLLGSTPTPDLQYDPPQWASFNVKRVVLQRKTSALYRKLCNPRSDNVCVFKAEVVLDSNLECDGLECELDQPRVVEIQGRNVFYEYVRPPCVQFPFYVNAMKIKERSIYAQSMCADPRLPAAEEACCPTNSDFNIRGVRNCAYTGERVTYPTASKRCKAISTGDYDTCTWRIMGVELSECGNENWCCLFDEWLWSNAACEILAKVDPSGQVALVHNHTDIVSLDPSCV